MKKSIDKLSNSIKNITHGFFLAIGTTIAEPATILPLIVNYFSSSSILVGFFASLLRGGAIFVQLIAAFYAQSHRVVLKQLRVVFLARFLSWFSIGVSIIIFGKSDPNLTLFLIGSGLFIFSFSAGFGAIYFKEIMAKMFSHKYRGKTQAYRQFFAGFGAILSGVAAGYILEQYEPPNSFGYLFIVSALFMAIGLIAFGTIEEPVKENVGVKEKSFKKFIKNSFKILKEDTHLKTQVYSFLLSYSYLIALPFIILDAKEKIDLGGSEIGMLISVQMIGAMLSNILWGKLSSKGKNRAVVQIALVTLIFSTILAIFADSFIHYLIIFFFAGAATDGFRLSFGNLILIIAPEEKRPVYIALQANITSFGLFFPIIGGVVVEIFNYQTVYILTLICLCVAFFISRGLKDV